MQSYTPLVNRIVNGGQVINNKAIKWDNTHEKDDSKTFMAQEAFKHEGGLNNVRKCELTVKADEPFLCASPDGLFSCKCWSANAPTASEIQNCKTCTKTWISKAKISQVLFANENVNGNVPHSHGHFFVWTTNHFLIERIYYDRDMWDKLHINASFFFYQLRLASTYSTKNLCVFFFLNAVK